MNTAVARPVLDERVVGFRTTPFEVEVEKGRLRLFAKAIGETDPVYFDEQAARAAGHPGLPVPPTFLFCLEMERPDPYDWFAALGIPLERVLHGEQAFAYHQMAYAGDTLRFAAEVTRVWHKKAGQLEFLVQRNVVTNQHARTVAEFDRTLVIRHPA